MAAVVVPHCVGETRLPAAALLSLVALALVRTEVYGKIAPGAQEALPAPRDSHEREREPQLPTVAAAVVAAEVVAEVAVAVAGAEAIVDVGFAAGCVGGGATCGADGAGGESGCEGEGAAVGLLLVPAGAGWHCCSQAPLLQLGLRSSVEQQGLRLLAPRLHALRSLRPSQGRQLPAELEPSREVSQTSTGKRCPQLGRGHQVPLSRLRAAAAVQILPQVAARSMSLAAGPCEWTDRQQCCTTRSSGRCPSREP